MTRRERLERKLEKRREWADKAQARSVQQWQAGSRMFDAIPLGQPILIGHHSEKRDRNYRNRAANHLDKSIEEKNLAEHHIACAGGIENALDRSIFSDDENAIEAIQARIAENEAKRERMVTINKLYRKGDAEGLAALGLNLESLKAKLAEAGSYWGKAPHLPYEMSNLGGRITADRKRLEFIKVRQTAHAEAEASPNGITIKPCQGGYVRVTFAEKPDRAILDALKAAGFFWCKGYWGGKAEALPEAVRNLLAELPSCT